MSHPYGNLMFMNLITVFHRFPDDEACFEHLEKVRWGNHPACPHCGSVSVARKNERRRIGRWNCHDCHSSFNALSGTIMSQTRLPLQKWFLAIAIIVNAKKSVSSPQLARDLDLTQQTALYLQQRIRAQMADRSGAELLSGIVEADETYVGGRPRRRFDGQPNPRGRGTAKQPVLGVVERDGQVRAQVTDKVSGKQIVRFLKANVDPAGSLLITDDYPGYRATDRIIRRASINHSLGRYADGIVHTNTIEGFWSLLKRAWYGTHHHYQRKFMPLYVAEAAWKYNHRRDLNPFGTFIAGMVAA